MSEPGGHRTAGGRPGSRPMGAVDTIWLHMDRPNNLMIIDAVMLLAEPVEWGRFCDMIRRRIVERFPVFRQHPVDPILPIGLPHWEDDLLFDLDRHLIRTRLTGAGDDADLQAYIETQIQRPFDPRHPLWEYHVIDGYGDGTAILARYHHAIGDGAALMEVLISTTDATPDGDLLPDEHPRVRHASPSHHDDHADLGGPADLDGRADLGDLDDGGPGNGPEGEGHGGLLGAAARLAGLAGSTVGSATAAARSALHLLEELPHLASHPHALVDALSLTQQTGQVAGKLLLTNSPASPLSGTPGKTKRVVWSTPRPLDDIKRAGRPAGATVNDVLLTAASAALAHYTVDHGSRPSDLVTLVPVNLRAPGEPLPPELGNKFALVFVQLPSGDYAPLERLSLAKQRMDEIKHSPEAVVTFGLIQAIGHTNTEIERVLVDFFSNKGFGVTTNVIGPDHQRYMAGSPLSGILGWVPGSGHQTLGICILTYNHTLRVGFKADSTVVPDPEKLVAGFDRALDDLLRLLPSAPTSSPSVAPSPTPAAAAPTAPADSADPADSAVPAPRKTAARKTVPRKTVPRTTAPAPTDES